jgi:hypothetical protein
MRDESFTDQFLILILHPSALILNFASLSPEGWFTYEQINCFGTNSPDP